MEFFIDSADIQQIRKYNNLSIFTGITTTPTFFYRQGIKDWYSEILKIVKEFHGSIHIEALGDTAKDIITNAEENSKLDESIVSKIPISLEGAKAVKVLKEKGIRTNMHLIFSLNQAAMAASVGPDYICPLIGRIHDTGTDAFKILEEIVKVKLRYKYTSKIMASSIRTLDDVRKSFLCGVDAITIPPAIIEQMFLHPLTDIGVQIFQRDILFSKGVKDVMKSNDDLPLIEETSLLYEALGVMTEKNIGLGIISKDRKMKGIITDGDIRRALKRSKDNLEIRVKEIMNENPITMEYTHTAAEALRLMESKRITSIVITCEGNPIGYINLHDILGLVKPS